MWEVHLQKQDMFCSVKCEMCKKMYHTPKRVDYVFIGNFVIYLMILIQSNRYLRNERIRATEN